MTYDFDLIVIGGGAAGLTAAGIGANLGAKTLMVERDRLGGDCTWTGCIPSKTLLKAAKVAHQIEQASRYGLTDRPVRLDFGKVVAHVHRIRREIYEDADAPERYEAMGVTVRFGEAHFLDAHTLALTHDGTAERLAGRYFVIAAGARAAVPPIEGLEEVPYLTSETLFEVEALPEHLAILGAGPIGTEMAQAFRRFGAQVTVLDHSDRILAHDDAELAGRLGAVLEREGIRYRFGTRVTRVAQAEGRLSLLFTKQDTAHTLDADALLVATGRQPNLDALALDAAGVAYTEKGITVDERCRTNQRHIFAAGDITGRYQFTHMSEHMAKVAATNALTKFPMKIDKRHVPWVTYTDPELAHVGATEDELLTRGTSFEVYRFPYRKIDRAVAEQEVEGWIKVYAKKWTGKILGVDILGVHAGELISEYVVAMRNGVTLRQIADTIHPYPSYGLGARRAADQWYVRNTSPTFVRLLQKIFRYHGPVPTYDPDQIV